MHHRYFSVAATIVTSVSIACGDARLDDVTAPPPAATPAAPVANELPTEEEYAAAGIPNALGVQVKVTPWFATDNRYFNVDVDVQFQWVNYVSATVKAWLVNQSGSQINSGQAALSWERLALPVPSGDTTFTVRISTNNITCGLIGKSSYTASAAQRAIDSRLVRITLFEQTIGETNGEDVLQPACPPDECEWTPSTRVPGGTSGILASDGDDCEDDEAPLGGEPVMVCFSIWRELWIYDFATRTLTFWGEWFVGTFCYLTEAT